MARILIGELYVVSRDFIYHDFVIPALVILFVRHLQVVIEVTFCFIFQFFVSVF